MRLSSGKAVEHTYVRTYIALEDRIRQGWCIYTIRPLGDGGYEFDLYRTIDT